VAVNYSLRRTDQGWKAWDVIIEGISYVKSFRDDFGSEIDDKGLDEVIARLEAGDKPAAIKGTSGKKWGGGSLDTIARGLSAASTAPAIDGQQAFVAVSSGVYRLEAPLTFATVPVLRQPGLERIDAASGDVEFDLQRVAASDSAGLALLIDWLAEARVRQRKLRD